MSLALCSRWKSTTYIVPVHTKVSSGSVLWGQGRRVWRETRLRWNVPDSTCESSATPAPFQRDCERASCSERQKKSHKVPPQTPTSPSTRKDLKKTCNLLHVERVRLVEVVVLVWRGKARGKLDAPLASQTQSPSRENHTVASRGRLMTLQWEREQLRSWCHWTIATILQENYLILLVMKIFTFLWRRRLGKENLRHFLGRIRRTHRAALCQEHVTCSEVKQANALQALPHLSIYQQISHSRYHPEHTIVQGRVTSALSWRMPHQTCHSRRRLLQWVLI